MICCFQYFIYRVHSSSHSPSTFHFISNERRIITYLTSDASTVFPLCIYLPQEYYQVILMLIILSLLQIWFFLKEIRSILSFFDPFLILILICGHQRLCKAVILFYTIFLLFKLEYSTIVSNYSILHRYHIFFMTWKFEYQDTKICEIIDEKDLFQFQTN